MVRSVRSGKQVGAEESGIELEESSRKEPVPLHNGLARVLIAGHVVLCAKWGVSQLATPHANLNRERERGGEADGTR